VFVLNTVEEDGKTYREMLEGLRDRARRPEKRAEYEAELSMPRLPGAVLHVWRSYQRLRKRKGSSGFSGRSPLEWPDIDAFLRITRVSLTPWEIELIEDLDDLFLMDHSKETLQ
jgi:hypothetical protein